MSARAAVIVALALGAGCGGPRYAIVDGRKIERPTLAYGDGAQYAIVHKRAFPDVLSGQHARAVDDGLINGKVCGLDVGFDVTWSGNRMTLSGRLDVPWVRDFTHTEGLVQLQLDVRETAPGRRRIVGDVNGGGYGIDIDAGPDGLTAQVGKRRLALTPDGSYLAGVLHDVVVDHPGALPRTVDIPYLIYGREALATMLPADEAVVLVLMFSCTGMSLERNGEHVRGFSLVRLD